MNLPVIPSSFSAWKHLLAVGAVCLALCAPRANAQAQVFDATHLGWYPRADLGTGWLVHAGDDPAYARPDFDDSHWTPFNATDSLRKLFPHSRPPVVWYRLHVKVSPGEENLSLREIGLSRAFAVYANGVPLLQAGSVTPFVPYVSAWLQARIPADQVAAGSFVIALRVHLSPAEWTNAYPGLRPFKVSLGEGAGLAENTWLEMIGSNLLGWLSTFISIGLMLGALLLYSAQRKQVEYLWLFLWGLASLLTFPLDTFHLLHTFPESWYIVYSLSALFGLYFYVRMYLAFVGWPIGRWLHGYLVLACLLDAAEQLSFNARIGTGPFGIIFEFEAPILLLVAGILPGILVVCFRRGNRDAGILLIPLLLSSLLDYVAVATYLLEQIPSLRFAAYRINRALGYMPVGPMAFGPFNLDAEDILNILSLISLALIILLRTNRVSRQQAMLESEMANARAVQQVLIPDEAPSIAGFALETVYRPAAQVGGDFFQAVPTPDGGALVAIGDVSGKGLPAAMTVSLLVGTFRSLAHYTQAPAEILSAMNQRMLARSNGGFTTCLVLRADPDGTVTAANAGHLAPYTGGKEIAVEAGLPLGLTASAVYQESRFRLGPGEQLTLLTDGVPEARNPHGDLFGFDRTADISMQPAHAIVDKVQAFGQQDDVTVVRLGFAETPLLARA